MTLDLAQAAALHRRAVDAGMEGIIPKGHRLTLGHRKASSHSQWAVYSKDGEAYGELATAAVTHWVREWCEEHAGPVEMNNYDSPEGLIELLDSILFKVEARNANPA